ncbi:MAG: succinate dehydrogenase, hydrophobic membrane anchor protein [Pseudomonadota bacterium]
MASSATKHFVMQRFTAMIQVPLVIWLIISIIGHVGDSRDEFMAWVGEPLTAGLMILFVLSICYHMHLGMDELIDDYIHKRGTRTALALLNKFLAFTLGVIAIFSIIAMTLIV